MALTTYKITIVNKNVAPVDVVGEGYKPIVVISPTGVTTPETPYAEWVSDNTSRLDGSVAIPAWKKLQYFILPASSNLVIATENSDEAAYYESLIGKFDNVDISLDNPVVTTYKVTLDKTTAAVTVESGATHTATITATSTPAGGTVTWTSSDTAIATVEESTGVVTGVAVGTCTITATCIKDGITSKATCEITVS